MFIEDTKVKQESRERLLSYVSSIKKALVLPGPTFKTEKLIREKFPNAHITGVENDWKVYEKGEKISGQYVNEYYYGDVLELLNDSYDFIWLDFCGGMSIQIINKLLSYVSTSMKPGVTLGITFNAKRDPDVSTLADIYQVSTKTFREVVFPSIMEDVAGASLETFKLKEIYSYISNKYSSMKLYIFQS